MLRHAIHQIKIKQELSRNATPPENKALQVPFYFSTLPKTKGGRRVRKRKNYKPISEILTSPKLQNDVTNRFVKMQEKAKSAVIPSFLRNRSLPKDYKPLVMDRNWWFYNICLSFMPGLLIVILCESQQEEMKEYNEKQRLMNLKRIYGEDYVSQLAHEMPEDSGRLIKMYDSIMTLLGLTSDNLSEMGIYSSPNNGVAKDGPDSVTTTNSTNAEKISFGDGSSIRDNDTNDAATNLNAAKASEEQVVYDLLHRIQALEKKLGINNEALNDEPLSSEYRLKRLGQSGVQNRVDDRIIDEYKKKENQLRMHDKMFKKERLEFKNDEDSLPASISETTQIRIIEEMKKKTSDFIENIALVIGYDREGNMVQEDAIDKRITISNDLRLEESKNNGVAGPIIGMKETSIGHEVVGKHMDDIEDDIKISKTLTPDNSWKVKSWIRKIFQWNKQTKLDSEE